MPRTTSPSGPTTTPRGEPAPPAAEAPARSRWATVVASVLALVALVVTAGPFLPLPVVSLGSALTPWIVPITAGCAGLAAATAWLLRRRRTAWRGIAAGAALLSLVAAGTTTAWQARTAHDLGIDVDWKAALLGEPAPETTADVEVPAYTRHDGRDIGLSLWRARGTTGPAPVLVFVHGGAWVTGSRFDARDRYHARWLAEHGYVVLSVDYSLSDADHHRWDVQEPQVACALVWAQRHVARYGGDIDRLGVLGSSAGGNIVADVAAKAAEGRLRSSCGGTVPRIGAVATLYGAADPPASYHRSDPVVRGELRDALVAHVGGTPEQVPDRVAAVSPIRAVTPRTPPSLWVHGTRDSLVPPGSIDAMVARLRAAGVETRQVRVPNANHVFDGRASIGRQLWREPMLAWFDRHLRAP